MRRAPVIGVICVGLALVAGGGCGGGGSPDASGADAASDSPSSLLSDGGSPSPSLPDGGSSLPDGGSPSHADSGPASSDGGGAGDAAGSGLVRVPSFGSNPAGLTMYEYVPASVPPNAPLVLVMHGCSQGAADMVAMGWDGVADAAKFYVVYPEQVAANNALLCFDWFGSSATLARGTGENLSIKQMVDEMAADYSIDPHRVFVTGFSAGAAEALLMLADWPDVFAGGAALSGIPYGCASSVTEAESCMEPGKSQTAAAWGALVQAADTGFAGPFPRVSLWHGTADGTVAPANLTAEVAQWTDVLGVSQTASGNDTVAGFPHATYASDGGAVVVESYEITGMDHDVPVDPARGCGTTGTYFVDEKLCAAKAIAGFFGIAGAADGGP